MPETHWGDAHEQQSATAKQEAKGPSTKPSATVKQVDEAGLPKPPAAMAQGERLSLRLSARLLQGRIELASGQLQQSALVLQEVVDTAGQAGLVVGLTNVSDDVLSRVQDVPLLIPGLGAQGGDLTRLDIHTRQAPNLINSSRSILYGTEGTLASRAENARDKIRTAISNA